MDIPWIAVECDEARAAGLASELGVSPIVARLLVIRGIVSAEEARAFFSPSLDQLHDPFLLPDMEVGVERVAAAMRDGEKICIHGDYDVDGVTSTALLVRTLRALKADVEYRVPHRHRDGYGVRREAVEQMSGNGCKVLITCDCGITACDSVRRAAELGIDVVVTDHHEPGAELPPAVAVINPKRLDASYPFPELAGVGVAFKFAQGLVRRLGHNEDAFISRFVDLTALGTVGDVVPLLGENRTIVKHGLEAIPSSKKIGLQTMLRATGLGGKPLTAYYLAFVLGPRINAVGRMDDATAALRLLLTSDATEAQSLAVEMERHNTDRKVEQDRVFAEAAGLVETKDLSRTRVLVLSMEGWNRGVVGIVASKICEAFGRPAILISRDEASGTGGGSARSVPPFNMIEGLRHCEGVLLRFGGHALAAGLGVELAKLDEFEEMINAYAEEAIPEEELLPRLEVDAELSASEITRVLADQIALMEPFGTANPEPLFVTRGLVVTQRQRVGDGSHLRLQVRGDGQAPVNCIAFRMGDLHDSIRLGGTIDLCYSIRLNVFNGTESVQLMAKEIRTC